MGRRVRPDTGWTAADIGDQRGRTAVVTGANTGIGFETAKALAEHGATVVLACRDVAKGEHAADRITTSTPSADVAVVQLDLASLESVRKAAERLRADHPHLDMLINNAGLMWPPFGLTDDGFELQFGTNHLGHFAFTGLLLEQLLSTAQSRIVTVSSNGHKFVDELDLSDLTWNVNEYDRRAAYYRSKLANLMFTYELQRRLAATHAPTNALAAHPGGSRTDLTRHSPLLVRIGASRYTKALFSRLVQDPRMGSLPVLRAAVDPTAQGGTYYGPGGWGEWTGSPVMVESNPASHSDDAQRELWETSERLTGVTYPFGPGATQPQP